MRSPRKTSPRSNATHATEEAPEVDRTDVLLIEEEEDTGTLLLTAHRESRTVQLMGNRRGKHATHTDTPDAETATSTDTTTLPYTHSEITTPTNAMTRQREPDGGEDHETTHIEQEQQEHFLPRQENPTPTSSHSSHSSHSSTETAPIKTGRHHRGGNSSDKQRRRNQAKKANRRATETGAAD